MNLILTFDYELFGDGSGDVFTHIIEPTNKILSLCDKYNIKSTFFFEALEYIKLKEEWDKGNRMGYSINPVKAIEDQIQKAYLKGHDIQLHIHPQWYNAVFVKGNWKVDLSNWRLGDFSAKDNYNIKDLIKDSKIALEAIIKPVDSSYKCIGLRAGGYNIMPSDKVYSSMLDLDFKFDSSVFAGGFEDSSLSNYDYRGVDNKKDFWWADETDIRKESKTKNEILEIPIFALPIRRWKRILKLDKLKSLVFRKKIQMSSLAKEKIGNKGLIAKIKFMLEKEASTWDVCIFSKSLHNKFFNYIENKLINKRNSFVIIGHPKSVSNIKVFEDFILIAKNRKVNYSFLSLKEYYESISN